MEGKSRKIWHFLWNKQVLMHGVRPLLAAVYFTCALLAAWILASPMSVSADVGPKPSVAVKISGLKAEEYYVTLLSEKDSTGPWSWGGEYYDYMGNEAAFQKFCEYEDADGFYFLSYMEECSEDNVFEWDYYPPGKFKILIYLPAEERFLTDGEIHERYAFDSYFSVKVNDGEVTADVTADFRTERSYDFTLETLSLLARVVLTILNEIALAWFFAYRSRKALTVIACTNIVTQLILNVLLNVINYKSGQWAFVLNYVWMEFVVFGIEAIVYKKMIGGTNPASGKSYHPWGYAFVANLASFAVGMWTAQAIPGIF